MRPPRVSRLCSLRPSLPLSFQCTVSLKRCRKLFNSPPHNSGNGSSSASATPLPPQILSIRTSSASTPHSRCLPAGRWSCRRFGIRVTNVRFRTVTSMTLQQARPAGGCASRRRSRATIRFHSPSGLTARSSALRSTQVSACPQVPRRLASGTSASHRAGNFFKPGTTRRCD